MDGGLGLRKDYSSDTEEPNWEPSKYFDTRVQNLKLQAIFAVAVLAHDFFQVISLLSSTFAPVTLIWKGGVPILCCQIC